MIFVVCYHPRLVVKLTFFDGSVKMVGWNGLSHDDDFVRSSEYYLNYFLEFHKFPDWYDRDRGCYRPVRFAFPYVMPCKQCSGCRLDRSRVWAVRCMHESELHDQNCFLTLTYDDNYLPEDGSLHKDHLQKFLKRLRKAISPVKVRFFACGEYGSNIHTCRPHYHVLLFGWRPDDEILYTIRSGSRLTVSPLLRRLWPFGFHTIGDCNFDSAAYVARYIMKKHIGKDADLYYDGLEPEFIVMSRKPGIAHDWIINFYSDVYPNDFVLIRDKFKCRPPKYYDDIYDRELNGDIQYIKNKRLDQMDEVVDLSCLERKEKVFLTKLKKKEILKRNYEENNI